MLDYECSSVRGVMLAGNEESEASDVTYPLNVRGWHAVYIGMYSESRDAKVMARLSDDQAFSVAVRSQSSYFESRIEDIFWKYADLTNQKIVLRQICTPVVPPGQEYGNSCVKSYIAYIKLVPLSEQEVTALIADRKRSDTRRLSINSRARPNSPPGSPASP